MAFTTKILTAIALILCHCTTSCDAFLQSLLFTQSSRIQKSGTFAVVNNPQITSHSFNNDDMERQHDEDSSSTCPPSTNVDPSSSHRRRHIINFTLLTPLLFTIIPYSPPAIAATTTDDDNTDSPPPPTPPLSETEIATRLRRIPTFTIVDTRGVPYMVFGSDAKLTAYFFTTFDEARRILSAAIRGADLARQAAINEFRDERRERGVTPVVDETAEREEFGSGNPWREARVSTVPLDFAVGLAVKRVKGVYFKVAPAEADVTDALSLSNITSLAEGKVPLFYFPDMTLNDETKSIPLYFRQSELLSQWKLRYPKQPPPMNDLQVTELFSVLGEMAREDNEDEEVKRLVFVPPVESERKAKECERKGRGESPFRLGERIVMM